MAVGDCERAFARAAAADGIELARAREAWLNQRGHLGLPGQVGDVGGVLEDIFLALGGDLAAQAAKRTTPLPGDYVHRPTGTLIEIDEAQHFTRFRLLTLGMYPPDVPVGFDVARYRRLCEEWASVSDAYRRTKPAVGFGIGGRQRQRAYHDALRDLVAPAMGRPPVIRIDAVDRDGTSAYRRARDHIHQSLEVPE